MNTNKVVQDAIQTTKEVLGGYFLSTCQQRLANGTGSVFEGIFTPAAMESVLLSAEWIEVQHPNIMAGCRGFMTRSIPSGRYGLVSIKDLPDDAELIALDPKGVGKVSMGVKGVRGPAMTETWLIIGPETVNDEEYQVVYTFHPGEPVSPSMVEVKDLPDGTVVTKAEAMELGFELAKVL